VQGALRRPTEASPVDRYTCAACTTLTVAFYLSSAGRHRTALMRKASLRSHAVTRTLALEDV
jgi:hypothetical protein